MEDRIAAICGWDRAFVATAARLLGISIILGACGGQAVGRESMQLRTEPQGQYDQEQASWQGIVPGVTTVQKVVDILGEPEEILDEDGRCYYLYPASQGGELFKNSIRIIDGKVVAMLIYPSEGADFALEQVTSRHGEPGDVAYSHFDSGTKVYVFATAGLAVTAYERDGAIAQSLYFVQMDLEEFWDTWGRNLPRTDPFQR